MGNVVQPLWADCPAVTRFVCAGLPAASISLMILGSALEPVAQLTEMLFTCSLLTVVKKFWVWTLLTGPLYSPIGSGMAFLFTLFQIYMGMMSFPIREKELGSMNFIVWSFAVIALISVAYLCVMFLFTLWYHGTFTELHYWGNRWGGLWPLIIVCLTLRMLGDPTGSTSFWGLVQIPNKWYPVAIVCFFCLLSGMRVLWELVAALAIGYADPWIKLEQRLLIVRGCASRLEQTCFGCCVRGGFLGASWVAAPNAQAGASWASREDDGRYSNLSDFGRSGGGQQLSAQGRTVQAGGSGGGGSFTAFAGSGNRLGSNEGGSTQPFVEMQEPRQAHEAPPELPPEPPQHTVTPSQQAQAEEGSSAA